MPDTPRQLGALQTLLADNATGDIGAQDIRDLLVSVYGPAWMSELGVTPSGETSLDEFDDDAFAGWTTVTVTGGQTITERGGLLSIKPTLAIQTTDTNCILQAHAISTGEAVEVAVSGLAADDARSLAFGPVITDGTDPTDDLAWTICQYFTNRILNFYDQGGAPTITNNGINLFVGQNMLTPMLYLRLEYDAANSFIQSYSVDKATWHEVNTKAVTMTPTHVGFGWTNVNAAPIRESVAIEYIRVVTV